MGPDWSLLFARPSFFEGVGRVIDFGGTLTEFNRAPSGAAADRMAFAADWRAIGHDLLGAIDAEAARLQRSRDARRERSKAS